MTLLIAQSQWCGHRVISLRADIVMDIWPTPEFPKGDEANQICESWQYAANWAATGLLLLGCDVAADPDDLAAMTEAVEANPGVMHTGMVKLWPASTSRDAWMWSHRGGTLGNPVVLTDAYAPIAYVSLGFLWVPGRLLDLAAPVMGQWQHGQADVNLSELALRNGIPARLVRHCQPKHLHFQREHDGDYIRRKALRAASIRTAPGDQRPTLA